MQSPLYHWNDRSDCSASQSWDPTNVSRVWSAKDRSIWAPAPQVPRLPALRQYDVLRTYVVPDGLGAECMLASFSWGEAGVFIAAIVRTCAGVAADADAMAAATYIPGESRSRHMNMRCQS